MPQRESERLFDESIGTAIEQIRALQDIELVIGIPFYNETQTLLEMLEIINTQLADYLTDKKPSSYVPGILPEARPWKYC